MNAFARRLRSRGLLCGVLAFPVASGAQTAPAAPKVSRVSPRAVRLAATARNANAYIDAVLDDNGKFSIGTVLGNPRRASDDGQKLIFGYPGTGTSDTMVRIDGVSSSIHAGASSGAGVSGSTASVTLTVGTVQILEQLSITRSPSTRFEDTVQIRFKITNTDSVAHAVSLRTQLDTQLGANDGAPFRVPKAGEVTTDTGFDNDPLTPDNDIPPSALVFDNLGNPTVISQFTFRDLGYTTPDRVVFGYWPVSVGAWDYTIVPGRSFIDNNGDGVISGGSPDSDSSVIVWWGYPDANAFNLAPGASKEFSILYGVGDYTFCPGSPFGIGLTSPAELDGNVQGAGYYYGNQSTFTVSGFFSNVVASTVTGARATLNLLPGFQLLGGQSATKPVEYAAGSGIVPPGKTAQVDWDVIAYGRHLGTQKLSLTAGNNTCLRDVYLTAIPNAIYGQATTDAGSPLAGAAITVYNRGVVVAAASTQSDGRYLVSGLPPGEYTVRLSGTGLPDSYFQARVAAGSDPADAQTVNPGAFAAGADADAFVYPNPIRQGNAKISFYTEASASATVEIFDSSGRSIKTISVDAPGPGWHEADWSVDSAANGVYFYKVTAGSRSNRGKIAVLKRRPQ